jgi:MFS family permease
MNTTSTQATADPGNPNKVGLLINRNYGSLLAGQTISLIGDQISTYTMLLWIVTILLPGKQSAPLAVSALIVLGIVPNLLVGPIAGVFVDRWNHRLTMISMDSIRAVLIALLLAFTGIGPLAFFTGGKLPVELQLGAIMVVTFLISTCAQFFSPSQLGLIAEVVPEKYRAQAVGLGQSMASLTTIIGPPLAAPLLFSFGLHWALIIDILSYVVSLLTLWAIRPPAQPAQPSPHTNVRSEFLAGLRFSFSNQLIRMLIITSAIASLGAGAFSSLYIFFIKQNLHTNVVLAGFIGASLGAGMIAGALLVGKFANRIGAQRILYSSLLLTGLIIIVLSRLTNFVEAVGSTFLLGLLLAAIRVAIAPIMLKETPKNMIGRVVSVVNPLTTIATLLAIILAGYLVAGPLNNFHWHLHWILSTTFGPIDTIFVGVGCIFCLAALYTYYSSSNAKKTPSR